MPTIARIKDAAARLAIPPVIVRRMIRQGLVSHITCGRETWVRVDEVKAALDRMTRPPISPPPVPTGVQLAAVG